MDIEISKKNLIVYQALNEMEHFTVI